MLTSPLHDYKLVTVFSEFTAYWDQYPDSEKIVAMDTEASGLNVCTAKMAGFSLSLQPGSGIYVPIGHVVGPITPPITIHRMVEFLRKKDEDGWTFLFYNAKYDMSILETTLNWWPKRFLDVLELVYMEDPDRQDKKLKSVAAKEIGYEMTKFEELFTAAEIKSKVMNITRKDSRRCKDYACADTDATLRLYYLPLYQKILQEQKFAIKVDTALVEVIRRVEYDGGLVLRKSYIETEMAALEIRAAAFKEQVWRMAGTEFELDSPKQLGNVLFERMGIESGGLTKKGQHKTDADTLDKLREANPIVEYVVCYRKIAKARGTYFTKLKRLVDENIAPRFNFNMYAAPTFRLAAPGGGPKTDGATGVNIQAVSNGEAREVWGVDLESNVTVKDPKGWELDAEDELFVTEDIGLATGMPVDEILIEVKKLAYVIEREEGTWACVRETCVGCPLSCAAGGIDVTRRQIKGVLVVPSVRKAFKAPEGFVLIAADYDKQELMIGANLSKERVWIEGLLAKVNLHEVTAALAFGRLSLEGLHKAEYKRLYDIGKMLNFAVFYGATSYTLSRKARISEHAAEEIYEAFRRRLSTLMSWISKVQAFARKNGYTTTYFGRKRYLKRFYDLNDRKWAAFADRSAVNTCIQGTGAEVTRIAMVKVAKWAERENLTPKEFRMVLTIHDELVYMVREELVEEIVPNIKERMEFEVKGWQVPLTVSIKKGLIWGTQEKWIPVNLSNENVLLH